MSITERLQGCLAICRLLGEGGADVSSPLSPAKLHYQAGERRAAGDIVDVCGTAHHHHFTSQTLQAEPALFKKFLDTVSSKTLQHSLVYAPWH